MDLYHLLRKLVHMQLKFLKIWAIICQELLDSARKSTADAIKTASNRAIQKTAEVTGDLIGNKIAVKITGISKSPKKLYWQNASKELNSITDENEIEIPKERCISPEKIKQIIDELRLIY